PVGRMKTIEPWPFSQGEIDSAPDGFIDAVFEQGPDLRHTSEGSRAGYAERIVRGGFPEAVARMNDRRRQRFFSSYIGHLVARDMTALRESERVAALPRLIPLLAARCGQLAVPQSPGPEAGPPWTTAPRER